MRKADIPSAHTMMAIGCIPDTGAAEPGAWSACTVRFRPRGRSSGATCWSCIGARFSDRVATNTKRFAPSAKVIHVDIDNAEINKNIGVDYAIVPDAETFLEKVMPYVQGGKARRMARADYRMADEARLCAEGRRERYPSAPAAPHGCGG